MLYGRQYRITIVVPSRGTLLQGLSGLGLIAKFKEVRNVPITGARHRNIRSSPNFQKTRDVKCEGLLQNGGELFRFFDKSAFYAEGFGHQLEIRIVGRSVRPGEFGSVSVLEVSCTNTANRRETEVIE